MNDDCPKTKACINNKCRDPCPGICGSNAECHVANHSPYCTCFCDYTGNPSIACHEIPKRNKKKLILTIWSINKSNIHFIVAEPITNPCIPSPCGPYSQCVEVNGHAVCSCLTNFIGSPPSCRPECTASSECSLDRACINQKCIDPCPGTCGLNARCQVTNHNPICSCSPGFTGDPFEQCMLEESKSFFLLLYVLLCFV